MTVSSALSLLEVEGTEVPSLFHGDEPIEVSVVTKDLTEQQTQWVREVKMLDALRAVAGMERARRLKWIRDDRFPEVAGNGGTVKDGVKVNRPGWAEFLRAEFDLRPDDANYESRGLETWETGKTMAKVPRPAGPLSEKKLGSLLRRADARLVARIKSCETHAQRGRGAGANSSSARTGQRPTPRKFWGGLAQAFVGSFGLERLAVSWAMYRRACSRSR